MGVAPPIDAHTLLGDWQVSIFPIAVAVGLVVIAVWYLVAVRRLAAKGRQWSGWRTLSFVSGLLAVELALGSSVAVLAGYTFTAHIAQHLLLMVIAPPLGALAEIQSVSSVLFGERRARTTWMLWGGFFFTQLVLLLMLNWLPSLMVGLGFTGAQASFASMGFNLGGAIGSTALGRLHAGRHRRFWVVLTYAAVVAALIVFIVGAQLILFALAPLYYGRANRGTGVGAAVAVGRLGSIVGPLYAGALLSGGGGSARVLTGIVPFVAIAGTAAFALCSRPQCAD